ncbi:acyltransferase family protein [Azoarcus sp. L1K30]|uniref:acyltransferase family protein n=1 Tax=Azoarcus sp. L1K30 TaxID=2820277 RepID=UPI001B816EFF|nr:acyltransferase family protein [Azoarcus sp. L1K30]MBR0568781.1 acyltransferase family protein [Azoarcus sp. L1K30]
MTKAFSHLSHPKYRPDIDGLRAVAVLAVIGFHAFPVWIRGGFIGVDIFFVISGFLISTIIFENLDNETFSFSEFYVRRVRRIFPALAVVLLVCLAAGWLILTPDELNQLGTHIAAGAGFVSNFVLWGEAGYFDNAAETKPLLHLWSLGIEEQFYIVWPLLLWLAWKRNFNLLTLTSIVALVSIYLNIKGVKQDSIATFYSPKTRFWELLCGSILAWLTIYKKDTLSIVKLKIDIFISRLIYEKEIEAKGNLTLNILSLSGCCLLAYGFWRINKEFSFPGKWAVIPVLGAVLIIMAGPQAWINRNLLSSRIAIWFGLISFPLYLWHWPLLSFSRIIENEEPGIRTRITAILISVVLAWLTTRLIEKPFRIGNKRARLKTAALCGLILSIGVTGFAFRNVDFSESHRYEKLAIKRKGFEHALGSSLSWYRGKNDWLYLGNAYDNTVAKIKLATTPSDTEVDKTKEIFSRIATTGSKHNTKLALIVAPNKASIYPEYLPDEITPSPRKYSSFFLEKLKEIPDLTVYDPTNDLISQKSSGEYLYWMTDTHWNNRGAFLTYSGFSRLFDLPIPKVEFKAGSTRSADLIGLSKLNDFPLHAEDSWDVILKENPLLTEIGIPNEQPSTFGPSSIATNDRPLSDMYIWVIGDSFTSALRQYFSATFREVRYVGHWAHKLNDLPTELENAERKPNMIVIVRVERSF